MAQHGQVFRGNPNDINFGNDRDRAALLRAQTGQAQFAAANQPVDFRSQLMNQQLGFATGGMNNLGQSIMDQFSRQNQANQNASLTIRAINAGSPVEQQRIKSDALTDIFGEGGTFSNLFGGGAGGGAGGFQSVGPDGNVISSVGVGQSQIGITPFGGLGAEQAGGLAAIGGLRNSQLQSPSGFGGTPDAAVQRQFSDINRAQSDRLATAFGRDVSQEGAQQQNASQQAIANAGVQSGNLFARMRNLPIQKRAFGQNLASRFAGQVA